MSDRIPFNMSTLDRILRILIGAAVFSLYFVGPQSDWALLGLLPIATGLVGFCPLYALIGVKTA